MYKVFINEHLLTLFNSAEFSTLSSTGLSLYSPDCQDLSILSNYLLKETKVQAVQLVYPTHDYWKLFTSCFNYLEAAGGLVYNESNDVLMIHRFKKWDLPKGKLEANESPSEAAIREVEEECGLDSLQIESELQPSFHIYEQKGVLHLKKTHWFKMTANSQSNLRPQKEEGIEEVKWMNTQELEQARNNTYASLKYLLA